MKLIQLDASFVSADGRRLGVQFLCPGCQKERLLVPFANPPDGGPGDPSMNAKGVLWQRTGDSLDDLTLTPSVDFTHHRRDLPPGQTCRWHGWIRDGAAVIC